jgi:hypothetical protein
MHVVARQSVWTGEQHTLSRDRGVGLNQDD